MSKTSSVQNRQRPTSDQNIVGAAVTSRLKAYYDDITHQAVPDRFMDLLAKLDASSNNKGGDNHG